MNVFVRKDDESVHSAQLRVFKEGTIEVGGLAEPEEMPTENIFEQIASGRFLTQIESGARIEILGLGSFVAAEARGEHAPDDLVREIRDMQESFAGRPSSGQRCARAWRLFQDAPTEANQQALREAYESVPSHLRMYLGDMDVKDTPIRMAIYGEEELEKWSHRVVAKERGMAPPPSITVPKVKG